MPASLSAAEILDREYLGIRARLIDIAAALDRIDRAEGATGADSRRDEIRRSLEIIGAEKSDRAEALQSVFSLPHQDDWKERFGL